MSISTIGGNNSAVASGQLLNVGQIQSSGKPDADSDNDRGRVSGSFGGGGRFASAITQALTQVGIAPPAASGTSDASAATATLDPQQALASFVQTLFAALHAQGGQQGPTPSDTPAGSDNANTVAAAGQARRRHGESGLSKLESALQNLIQQLASPAQSGSDPVKSGASSSNVSLSNLEQSFNNLLSADGISGSGATGATLSSFLQSLSQNLHGTPTTGNVLSTSA